MPKRSSKELSGELSLSIPIAPEARRSRVSNPSRCSPKTFPTAPCNDPDSHGPIGHL